MSWIIKITRGGTQRNAIFLRRKIFSLLFAFFAFSVFATPEPKEWRNMKVLPSSEIFFTQTENCYELFLSGASPSKIQMELPDLPYGAKFISSKKEEFSENGERGTLISLWFTFSESGTVEFPPLAIRIDGKMHYIEFESVRIYENPNLIQPILEIHFTNPSKLRSQNGRKIYQAQVGEKIAFTVSLRYGVQVLNFSWKIPKDSIFSETERFEFANGTQKLTEFKSEAKNLARFEWQPLREGIFPLPEIAVTALAFNGTQAHIFPPTDIEIEVSPSKQQKSSISRAENHTIVSSAFEMPGDVPEKSQKEPSNREDFRKMAENERLSLFEKIFSKRRAIFAGGTIHGVPEEKSNAHTFGGGQKVKITENAGDWSFVECEEFSGWTKNENLFEIK